ncbi:MAG: ATPase, T2SS/T4P/T4SS family [Breznakia sp.]
MKKKINVLMKYIEKCNATDVHFTLKEDVLNIHLRGIYGIEEIKNKNLNAAFFHYLKFISNLDLANSKVPQSGNFSFLYKGKMLNFRFAFLHTTQIQSAVLRILNNHKCLELEDLSEDISLLNSLSSWTHFRSGLVLISGPTGSGKSTTLHAILKRISENHKLKVITLEDPIEIQSETYLQLQINEKMDFDYEEGIKHLLRHDPDVIMIGEVRDEKTAKMLVRCALSGHMVFTTIHSKNAKEAVKRLEDFGVLHNDIKEILTGVTNQRIYLRKEREERVCIYEILEGEALNYVMDYNHYPKDHRDIQKQIVYAVEKNWIYKEEAQQDFKF